MLGTTTFCYLFSLYVHRSPLGKELKQERNEDVNGQSTLEMQSCSYYLVTAKEN